MGAVRASRRSLQVLGLVGAGHAASHFYMLALPPLFPLLRAEFDASYAALGLLVTLSHVATGAAQLPAGFLADRIGARALLYGGLALMGGAMVLIGLAPSYALILPLVLLAGLGNSVVHPADYVILSASIDRHWLGRAFGIHTFAGHLGFVAAPPTMILVTALAGWRAAIVTGGFAVLAITALLVACGGLLREERGARAAKAPAGLGLDGLRLLASPPIVLLFLFYVATSMVMAGVQTFSVTALVAFQGVDLAGANVALTTFLVAGATGILIGGIVADRTTRHALITGTALSLGTLVMLVLGLVALPLAAIVALFAVAGLLQAGIRPVRDLMVRAVTPEGATGKVFAFVMTGLNVGWAITPILFGVILDRGAPQLVFLGLAGAFLLSALAIAVAGRAARAAARPLGAAAE